MSEPAASFDATWSSIADVEGWLSHDQARRLWDRAAALPAGGRIVEIGSYRGRSAIVLASAAPECEVVAIDPHAGTDRGPRQIHGSADEGQSDNDAFRANLARAGVADRVRHVRQFSHDAVDEVEAPIDLLYIDGAHGFRAARHDIVRWSARLAPGATLLVHDSFSSVGVTLALLTTTFTGRRLRYAGRSRSLAEYHHEPLPRRARLANAARQALQLPWFARNVAIKALLVARLGRLTRLLGHRDQSWPY